MRKIVFAAVAAAGLIASPAFAQDRGASGFHVEALVGYDASDDDLAGADGILYGLGAGYDFAVGNRVTIGPEIELNGSSADACEGSVIAAGDVACLDAGRDIYLGARVGYRFGRNSLAYAGVGYTNAAFELSYDGAGAANDFVVDTNLDGVRLKAGAEFGIGSRAFVRTEYRYSAYGEEDVDRHQLVTGVGIRF